MLEESQRLFGQSDMMFDDAVRICSTYSEK